MKRINHKLIISLAVIAALTFLFWPSPERGPKQTGKELLPWESQLNENGHISVMGVEIGDTTLKQARKLLGGRAEVALFQDKGNGQLSAEAFFSEVTSGGLSGRIIVGLAVPGDRLYLMAERADKRKPMETGNIKLQPHWQDRDELADSVIKSVTYIPYIDLDDEVIRSRFGEPKRTLETQQGILHYLYPQKGLDVLLDPNGKEVIQYVNPADFTELLAPLQHKNE